MTLKRYRMQIVDGLIQARHDAGTGEWYAASEVEEEMGLDKLRIATSLKIGKDDHISYEVMAETMLSIMKMSMHELRIFIAENTEYKPE